MEELNEGAFSLLPIVSYSYHNLCQTKLKEFLMAFIYETSSGWKNNILYPNISYTIYKLKNLMLRFFFQRIQK